MKINQAFTILQRAGGIRAARIITENRPKLNTFGVWRMARQLRRGVPVAKIIHRKWFYGLPFYTNSKTLDPRPDTETLVAAVIADLDSSRPAPRILDLGTGTGCIIASIVKNVAGAHGVAVDKSFGALRVARKNIHDLGLDGRVRVMHGTFEKPPRCEAPFDIIVSNPPYIATGDARVDHGAMHDPKMALYATGGGLDAYRAIACNAWTLMRDGGKIYMEIGEGQDPAVREIFECAGWRFVRRERDLGGIERVVIFQK